MRIFASVIVLLVVAGITGCQANSMESGVPLETPASPTVLPRSTELSDFPIQGIATPDRISATMTKKPERVPPTEAATQVTGEVPARLLDSILKDLAGRTGAAQEMITVIQAQATVWKDGSLGCPQPGVMYTQALVNGYWVILQVGNQKYDYRAAETGFFFLCGRGLPPVTPPGTPSS
jgi:hypothetical protein